MHNFRSDVAIATCALINDLLADLLTLPVADRRHRLTQIILEAIYVADGARQTATVAERHHSWASMAACEIINLHIQGDDPPCARFEKIAGVIRNAMGHAHREERLMMFSVLDN